MPIAKPAARPARPTERPAPRYINDAASDIETSTVRGKKVNALSKMLAGQMKRTRSRNEDRNDEAINL
jgi:hypothetical protein